MHITYNKKPQALFSNITSSLLKLACMEMLPFVDDGQILLKKQMASEPFFKIILHSSNLLTDISMETNLVTLMYYVISMAINVCKEQQVLLLLLNICRGPPFAKIYVVVY